MSRNTTGGAERKESECVVDEDGDAEKSKRKRARQEEIIYEDSLDVEGSFLCE